MENQNEIWELVEAYLPNAKQEEKVALTNQFMGLFNGMYDQFCEQERFDKFCQNDRVKGQDNNKNI